MRLSELFELGQVKRVYVKKSRHYGKSVKFGLHLQLRRTYLKVITANPNSKQKRYKKDANDGNKNTLDRNGLGRERFWKLRMDGVKRGHE